MLQRDLRIRHLTLTGCAAQLPHKLRALRETGRTEWVSLREQTAGGVGDPLAAEGVVAIPDQLLGFAFFGETNRLVGQHFVCGEAVVKLDDLHIVRAEACLVVDLLRCDLRHVVADHLDHRGLKARREVCRHRLAGDVDALADALPLREVLAAENRGGSTTRGRAALVARERIEDLGAREDFFDGVRLLEERVGVLRRVLAGLLGDLRKRLALGAVAPSVLPSCTAEHLRGAGCTREALHVIHHACMAIERVRAVAPLRCERSLLHLLKADDEHALGDAAFDCLASEHQGA